MGMRAVIPPNDDCPHLHAGSTIARSGARSTDISYIPIARGFIYLVAIVEWFSR